MKQDNDKDAADAKQGRLAAIVIAGSFVLWLVAQQIGGALGLPVKYAFLIDLCALAALFWALVVSLQLWRRRREN